MDPDHMMRHSPGQFGYWHLWHWGWHGIWPELFGLALPLLLLLPLLALLAVLLWPRRHALLNRLGVQPAGTSPGAGSAAEMFRQRYPRDEMGASTPEQANQPYEPHEAYGDTDDGQSGQMFRPRPDVPIDWS